MVRKRKKKEKLRGHRTHGKGDTKNKRGGGSRGGCGRAGAKKHKFMLFRNEEPKKRLKPRAKKAAISIRKLEKLLEKLKSSGKIDSKDGFVVVDGKKLGFERILSNGIVKTKLMVLNAVPSKKAKEKILAAGGVFVSEIQGADENKK
ncbi:MAG: uL15 family ribosomal protein [Candidatus Diapherotrites archaeon]|nr:uL15 family ribosomal protein [Candidatus Diapherotrites archaeon]